jgi:hypothetical protein
MVSITLENCKKDLSENGNTVVFVGSEINSLNGKSLVFKASRLSSFISRI